MFEGLNGLELTIKGVVGTSIIPYANVQMYITEAEPLVTIKPSKAS
jgi:hypothetical protein